MYEYEERETTATNLTLPPTFSFTDCEASSNHPQILGKTENHSPYRKKWKIFQILVAIFLLAVGFCFYSYTRYKKEKDRTKRSGQLDKQIWSEIPPIKDSSDRDPTESESTLESSVEEIYLYGHFNSKSSPKPTNCIESYPPSITPTSTLSSSPTELPSDHPSHAPTTFAPTTPLPTPKISVNPTGIDFMRPSSLKPTPRPAKTPTKTTKPPTRSPIMTGSPPSKGKGGSSFLWNRYPTNGRPSYWRNGKKHSSMTNTRSKSSKHSTGGWNQYNKARYSLILCDELSEPPSSNPSYLPSSGPSPFPSPSPSLTPSSSPTKVRTNAPTRTPTSGPTLAPSVTPSKPLSQLPSVQPTLSPSFLPTNEPSAQPSREPTTTPTQRPTQSPTQSPSLCTAGTSVGFSLDIVFLFDQSGSMMEEMELLRSEINSIFTLLAGAVDTFQAGLVAFGQNETVSSRPMGKAELLQNLTDNQTSFSMSADELISLGGFREPGFLSLKEISENSIDGLSLGNTFPFSEGYCVILFTDEDSDILIAPEDSVNQTDAEMALLATGGILFEIGLVENGLSDNRQPDEYSYFPIANATGGSAYSVKSFNTNSTSVIEDVLYACIEALADPCPSSQPFTTPSVETSVVPSAEPSHSPTSNGCGTPLIVNSLVNNDWKDPCPGMIRCLSPESKSQFVTWRELSNETNTSVVINCFLEGFGSESIFVNVTTIQTRREYIFDISSSSEYFISYMFLRGGPDGGTKVTYPINNNNSSVGGVVVTGILRPPIRADNNWIRVLQHVDLCVIPRAEACTETMVPSIAPTGDPVQSTDCPVAASDAGIASCSRRSGTNFDNHQDSQLCPTESVLCVMDGSQPWIFANSSFVTSNVQGKLFSSSILCMVSGTTDMVQIQVQEFVSQSSFSFKVLQGNYAIAAVNLVSQDAANYCTWWPANAVLETEPLQTPVNTANTPEPLAHLDICVTQCFSSNETQDPSSIKDNDLSPAPAEECAPAGVQTAQCLEYSNIPPDHSASCMEGSFTCVGHDLARVFALGESISLPGGSFEATLECTILGTFDTVHVFVNEIDEKVAYTFRVVGGNYAIGEVHMKSNPESSICTFDKATPETGLLLTPLNDQSMSLNVSSVQLCMIPCFPI